VLKKFFQQFSVTEIPAENATEDIVLRLMFELAVSDGSLDKAELAMLKKRAKEISQDDEKISSVIKSAINGAEASTSLYPTINQINNSYSLEQKKTLLERLWELVSADGIIDHQEENLYFKIAELIYVKRSHANQIKQQKY
jgi:uncharacterized tellurite resistance protein B-like protein